MMALVSREDAWWEDEDPASGHRRYLQMYASPTNRSKAAVIEKLLSEYPWQDVRVLEYGCGGGEFTLWMARRGAEVWAVDRNVHALAILSHASREAGLQDRIHPCEGHAEDLEIDGEFDFVFAKDLLEHLSADQAFLDRVASQTRPGGHLFLATQNDRSLNYWTEGLFQRRILGRRDWRGWNREHLRFYNAALLTVKMKRSGFSPERWGSSYLIPWRFLTRRLTGRARTWAGWQWLDRCLGTLWPWNRMGWSILVVGRRSR